MSKQPKLEVVDSPEDASGCEMIVCAPALDNVPLIMPDNKMEFCNRCGQKVQYRPNGPIGPKYVCWECAMPELEKELAKGGDCTLMVTRKTMEEVREYLRKQRRQ